MCVELTSSTAQFVHAAHFVTVFEDGKVTHNQVSLDQLDSGLIGAIERTASRTVPDGVQGEGAPAGSPSKSTAPAASQQVASELDAKRARGDVSLYKFYFKSIGWAFSLSFIALAVVWQVLEKLLGMMTGSL